MLFMNTFLLFLALQKRSSRTQQAKLHNEGSPSGKWHLALTQTACFIADRRFDPDTLNLWTRDGIADMKDLGSFAVNSGVPVQIGSCPPLSTYGCVPFVDLLYYYSQLASDGAVVLCKLGDCAAMVLVVSTSAFQAERAGSSPVGCSNLVWVGFLAVKSGCACARYHPERG